MAYPVRLRAGNHPAVALENLLKRPHRKRFIIALGAAAAGLLLYLTADRFAVIPGTGALDSGDKTQAPSAGARSIAILPFREESADVGRPYFGRGIAREVAERLARHSRIDVIDPDASLAFASYPTDQTENPNPLGVTYTLGGTAQVLGEGVAVEARLSELRSGSVMWTARYRKRREEISRLPDTLARAVIEVLGVEAPAADSARPPVSPAAYLDYLEGRELASQGTKAALDEAAALFERCLGAAPDFAPGWTSLGGARMLQARAGSVPAAQALPLARAAIDRALALDPESPTAHLYRSQMQHAFDWDWRAAEASARQALRLAPGDADVLAAASTAALTLGKFDAGTEWIEKAIALDPVNLDYRLKYGLLLEFGARYREAIEAYRELMALQPGYPGVHAFLGRTLVLAGKAEAAMPHVRIERSPFWALYGRALVSFAIGKEQDAEALLRQMIDRYGHEAAFQVAEIYALNGHVDEAFAWLERAVDQRDPGLSALLGNRMLASLEGDPRWRRLTARLGLDGGDGA